MIRLNWPVTALSPNTRQHWARLARARASYRLSCQVDAIEQGAKLPPGDRWDVHFRFVPGNRRRIDIDNLLARMKAGLDGLADALRVDDSQFVRLSAEIAEPEDGAARVEVTFTAHGAAVAK